MPDKKASDGKKWEKAVRFFIVRPNRVGNQFYDDKPNGGCYMDWNENFSPVPQLQVHSVRILKIWSPWFYNAGAHICNDLNLIQQGLSQLYSSRNIGLSPIWKSHIFFLPNTPKLALVTQLLYNKCFWLPWNGQLIFCCSLLFTFHITLFAHIIVPQNKNKKCYQSRHVRVHEFMVHVPWLKNICKSKKNVFILLSHSTKLTVCTVLVSYQVGDNMHSQQCH